MQPAGLLALIWDKRLEKRDRVIKVHRSVASSLHCSLPLTAHAITWALYAPPHTLILSTKATPTLFHWIPLSRPQDSYTPPSIDCDVTHWHLLDHPFTPLITESKTTPFLSVWVSVPYIRLNAGLREWRSLQSCDWRAASRTEHRFILTNTKVWNIYIYISLLLVVQ